MKSKLQISIVAITVFGFMFLSSCKMNYDSNFVSTLPVLTLSNNTEHITGQIIRYNINKTSGSIDQSKYSNEVIKVSKAGLLQIEWSEAAHTYGVQLLERGEWKNVSVSENTFIAPLDSGIYEYKVVADWYDKGSISYYFKINVE